MNLAFAREVGIGRYCFRAAIRQCYRYIGNPFHEIVLPTGLPILLPHDSGFASDIFITKANVDWGAEALLVRFLDPAGVFYDVGANIGYYTLYVLPKVTGVTAFEPDPRNLPNLRANLNRFPKAQILTAPVFRQPSEVWFQQGKRRETSAILPDGPGPRSARMRAVSLDSVWEEQNRPFVTGIKIDVEGGDFDVLQGATKLVDYEQPIILTELSARKDFSALHAWVTARKYTIFAHVRVKPGSRILRLRPVDAVATSYWKMLFVVPARLTPTFGELVNSHGAAIH